jgi:hypothetical protein
MNSIGNHISAMMNQQSQIFLPLLGKRAIVVKQFSNHNLLNSFTPKPLKNNRSKLQIEIPWAGSNQGNNGDRTVSNQVEKNVGSTIEITPKNWSQQINQ